MANFQNYLGLDIHGFRQGIVNAKKNLNDFKNTILQFSGALGVGIGFGSLISSLKDTVTQLSVAKATLENVSRNALEYSQNMEWLDEVARTYHQDLGSLIESFAQFSAACKGTSLTLDEQRHIYESLTKAATYFHMSADRTQYMMIAIEQMMSKGKVSAEELRRQLGNNLPGAFQMMQKAYQNLHKEQTITLADFEKLMSTGKIISSEVLPEFARQLDEMVGDKVSGEVNSLQLALNDLKSAWERMADSTGFEETLTRIYKLATSILEWMMPNIKKITASLTTLAVGVIGGKLIAGIVQLGRVLKGLSLSSWIGMAITGLGLVAARFLDIKNNAEAAAKAWAKVGQAKADVNNPQNLYQQKADLEESYKQARAYINDGKKLREYNKSRARYQIHHGDVTEDSRALQDSKIVKTFEDWVEVFKYAPVKIRELDKAIAEYEKSLEPDAGPLKVGDVLNSNKGSTKKEKTVKSELEDYRDELKKLNNQFKAGSINEDEYRDSLNKASEKAWEAVTAFDNFREEIAKLPEELQNVATSLEGNFNIAKLFEYYEAEAKEAVKASEEAKKRAQKIAKAQGEIKGYDRDTFFDYKKDDSTINNERSDAWQDVADSLKDYIEALVDGMDELDAATQSLVDDATKQMEEAQAAADSFKKAADMAEWAEDAKKAAKDYSDAWKSGLKDTSMNMDRLANAYKQMMEAMGAEIDEDAWQGWEKFITTINTIVQSLETIASILQTIKGIQEAINVIKKVQNAEGSMAYVKELGLLGLVNKEKRKNLILTGQQVAADVTEAGAATTAAAAKTAQAAAGGASAVSSIPYVGPALAVAAVAAIVAAIMASTKGFAKGGIVGGNSYSGDKILARLNSGEGVLTANGMQNLSKLAGAAGEVQFRIKGSDLVGCISNYNNKIKG